MPKNNAAAIKDQLKAKINTKLEQRAKPLWDGPYSDTVNGGVTYSLLSKFLCCRHRFWLRSIKGLKPEETFEYRIEYGNAWHLCEELHANGKSIGQVLLALKVHCVDLAKREHGISSEVNKLYQCISVQFPHYVDYWAKHEDMKGRTPIAEECEFKVAYKLPSGRVVILRGKIDAIDLVKKLVWIQENKTKSDIKQDDLQSDLLCDLQSMLYCIVVLLLIENGTFDKQWKLGGIRYNVIRRPLSGFKFNIKQKKGLGKAKKGAETEEMFYERLSSVIQENASQFFVRMRIGIEDKDIQFFKSKVLNPILEQLCDWYDSIQSDPFDPWNVEDEDSGHCPKCGATEDTENILHITNTVPSMMRIYCAKCNKDIVYGKMPNKHHYLFPSGIYNPMLEDRKHPFDSLIYSNDEHGFTRAESLFSELGGVK